MQVKTTEGETKAMTLEIDLDEGLKNEKENSINLELIIRRVLSEDLKISRQPQKKE